jgi:hypothetical protein
MTRHRHAILAGLFFLAAAGCSSLEVSEKLAWPGAALTPKPKVPSRMTDLWSDAVLYQQGMQGVRGFGGRIMFYHDESPSPIAVDGTLTVFAYDESKGEASFSAPDKKFVFLPDQLPQHYSKSELGHSYSFWLPWDEIGGPRCKICLIARFEPKKGQMITSQPCRKVLPGEPTKAEQQAAAAPPGGIRPVSHLEPVGDAPRRESAATVTIDVPTSFARPAGEGASEDPSKASGLKASLPGPGAAETGPTGSTKGERPADDHSAKGAIRPLPTETPPADRFARRRFPAQRGPTAPRAPDPVRRQPIPATWPSPLPATPRSDWLGSGPATPGGSAPSRP